MMREFMDRDAMLREAAGEAVGRETERALDVLERLLSVNPDDVDALLLRGHVLEMRGESDGARQAYIRVLEIEPLNVHALIDIADCEYERGRVTDALTYLESALRQVEIGCYRVDREAEAEEILERQHKCLMKLGRVDDALQVLEKGSELAPQSEAWPQLRKLHHQGNDSRREGELS